MIISFSGIDGAGKSTQILALQSWLESSGVQVTALRFWDDIVAFARLRESMSRKAFRGDQGIGSPERPLHRRDKNVSSPALTTIRACLYFADAISLTLSLHRVQHQNPDDVVILDRYIYDELANLPLRNPLVRGFTRILLGLAPKPDVAFLLDAAPEAARARKPEYPLEFLDRNRESYIALSRIIPDMYVIEDPSVDGAQQKIRQRTLSHFPHSEAKSLLCQ